MEEVVDGTRRGVVVECKHTGTVGRPVVQKLHSAVATFEFDGPKRGMVATTGRFTGAGYRVRGAAATERRSVPDRADRRRGPARDRRRNRARPVQRSDRNPVRRNASAVRPGDIDNGTRRGSVPRHRQHQSADLPAPHSQVTFRPVVAVTADTNAVFETSVGVVHRVNERSSSSSTPNAAIRIPRPVTFRTSW